MTTLKPYKTFFIDYKRCTIQEIKVKRLLPFERPTLHHGLKENEFVCQILEPKYLTEPNKDYIYSMYLYDDENVGWLNARESYIETVKRNMLKAGSEWTEEVEKQIRKESITKYKIERLK